MDGRKEEQEETRWSKGDEEMEEAQEDGREA